MSQTIEQLQAQIAALYTTVQQLQPIQLTIIVEPTDTVSTTQSVSNTNAKHIQPSTTTGTDVQTLLLQSIVAQQAVMQQQIAALQAVPLSKHIVKPGVRPTVSRPHNLQTLKSLLTTAITGTDNNTLIMASNKSASTTIHYNDKPVTDYHFDLFDYYQAPETCLVSTICPGIQLALNMETITDGEHDRLCNSILLCAVCPLLPLIGGSERERMRDYLNMPRATYSDILSYLLCMPCALTQDAQEIQLRKSLGYKYLDTVVAHTLACNCIRCAGKYIPPKRQQMVNTAVTA